MAQPQAKILILGDELGQGEPLKAALEREGHECTHVLRPDDAFPILSGRPIDYVFVDCMLQGSTNGVDFILHVREHFPQVKAKYVLMSGIFTDRAFIKESLERSKAQDFIEKKAPFDPKPYLKQIKASEESPGAVPPARKILYQMFSKEKVSTREKRKIIESLETVSGFDLPFIYSLLVETGSSGYLNIYEKNGSVSGISISGGCIVGVDVEDKTTYLGEMLIQSGYVRPEDVAAAIAGKSNQKLGTRLINANQLSPHAFDLILTEQMNIRLSRTIQDGEIRINFAATDLEKSSPNIDSELLLYYLHDWIASKIPLTWLKSLYMMWAGHVIQLTPVFKEDHPALEMGLVKALPGFADKLRAGTTLNRLLEEKIYNEAAVYKGLHFLLTRGLIIYGSKAGFRSDTEQQAALRKIWNDIQGKNPFEIVDLLGLENIQAEALENLLGPKPVDMNGATSTLWQNLRTKLEEAARKAVDSQSRQQFKQSEAGKEAEAKLRGAQKVEEARQALALNQYAKALDLLQSLQKAGAATESLHILLAWAKIGLIDPSKKATLLKEIEFELVQVPAEDRYDAHYSFVLGLFHRAKGDLLGAKKYIERAIALNSSLMAARREMSAIEAQLKKEKDIFASMDLKGLVGGLFKRK